MEIIDFISISELVSKNEVERAKLLCYFHLKETQQQLLSMSIITELFLNAGFNAPNTSRLKEKLLKTKCLKISKSDKDNTFLEFIPAVLQSLEREYRYAWNDNDTIVTDSELLDEQKFCGKRPYLDRLLKQINSCYNNNCYDACAVIMRRLFEALLIISYQKLGIDDQIMQDGNYVMLQAIVKNAKNNQILKLSRIKNDLDLFRDVGNYSAHSITYTASKKDIDDIKLKYRVMLEELYNKAGIMN